MTRRKKCFTLAEGTPCSENLTFVARHAKKVVKAPCFENLRGVARCAFTLVEVPPEPKAILSEVKIMTNAFNDKAKNGDYWLGAKEYCESNGYRLPTEAELATIANSLYTGMQASATDSLGTSKYGTNNARIGSNEPVPDALSGLGSSWNYLWSGAETSLGRAYYRGFTATYSSSDRTTRNDSNIRAVCVAD